MAGPADCALRLQERRIRRFEVTRSASRAQRELFDAAQGQLAKDPGAVPR